MPHAISIPFPSPIEPMSDDRPAGEPASTEPDVAPTPDAPAPPPSATTSSTSDASTDVVETDAKTNAPVKETTAVAVAAPAHKPSWIFFAVVAVVVTASDLWSKAWAVKHLLGQPAKQVVKGRLAFVLAKNPGGAWGMLHDQPDKWRKPFFLVVSVVAVFVIIAMYRKLDPKQHALKWGLPLVLGGAVGNFVDRVRYGEVVDFIDVVYWKNSQGLPQHWPTFNVADIAICVGVLLMAVDFLFPTRKVVKKVVKAPAASSSSST